MSGTELAQTELVRTELVARVEIRQLEELEVFNALRLSMEDAAEALAEVASGLGYRSQIWLVVPVVQAR